MEILKYLFLGLVQGFTEPIPISSSGHLVIIKNLLKMENLADLNFEIIVNFGSLLAILFLYRKMIIELVSHFFMFIKTKDDKYKKNFRYCLFIVIGTIPAGLLGLLLKDQIDLLSSNVKIIGGALLITALALFIIRNMKGKKSQDEITYLDAIKVGLFQAVALLPGLSRSGATITGGMLCDIKKEDAVNFSFMLYIPISIASMIGGVKDLATIPNLSSLILPYFIGMIASMVMTYFSAKWFLGIIKKNKLIYFVIYCLIVGSLVLIFM